MPRNSPQAIKRRREKFLQFTSTVGAKAKALSNKIGNKIIDKTSDVLSKPARVYHGIREDRGNREADILKKARMYDDAPNLNEKGEPTEAAKIRSAADAIRMKKGHKPIY